MPNALRGDCVPRSGAILLGNLGFNLRDEARDKVVDPITQPVRGLVDQPGLGFGKPGCFFGGQRRTMIIFPMHGMYDTSVNVENFYKSFHDLCNGCGGILFRDQ